MAPSCTRWCSWLLSTLLLTTASSLKAGAAEIVKLTEPEVADAGANVPLSCTARPVDATVWWTKDGTNVSLSSRTTVVRETKDKSVVSHLTVSEITASDQGDYTCHVSGGKTKTVTLRVKAGPELVSSGGATARVGAAATVTCSFRASPPPTIDWSRSADKLPIKDGTDRQVISVRNVSDTEVESLLTISNVTAKDGGQLTCTAANEGGSAKHTVYIVVQRAPEVSIVHTEVVGRRIFVNWTSDNGNSAIQGYKLGYSKIGDTEEWQEHSEPLPGNASSTVLRDLEFNASYRLRLTARNSVGESTPAEVGSDGGLHTDLADPVYKPVLSVRAATTESLTLSWSQPPHNISSHIQSYRLMRVDPQDADNVAERTVLRPRTLFLWPDLRADRTYTISVRACNDLVDLCGPWSAGVKGSTLPDKLATPRDVLLQCRLDRHSTSGTVLVTWQPPLNTAGLDSYTVTVSGRSEYLGVDRSWDTMSFGPDWKTVPATEQTTSFSVPPNTNYTVRVCAGSARGGCGSSGAARSCGVAAGLPDAAQLRRYNWWRVKKKERWLLQLQVDRVPERNGPICCYRVVVVRLRSGETAESLPPPGNVTVLSYDEVEEQGGGAYLADAFEPDFDKTKYVEVGDGRVTEGAPCRRCPLPDGRRRRHLLSRLGRREARQSPQPHDGPLAAGAEYAAFVQLVVLRRDGPPAVAHTQYTAPLTPAPAPPPKRALLGIILGIVCALVFCLLVLLATLYALKRYGKDVAVSRALREMLGSVRGQTVSGSSVLNLPPVARNDLVQAYQERHRDSDLGFRREFECLPQRLHDRTTYASEAVENFKKNRYPDIRAYDQTRVKLSQIDGVQSSEYINANFVWGYKERKKFICAQGPLEATIVDFWRMVWEHCCELMIMLTNLEEVGRTKCAKYWPEEGEATFGAITVSLAEEKPYSDYIQRVLSLRRPRADGTVEVRRITHMHYLVWKDFMAPEYPTGILRFIKRINEMYTLEMGPILVHCSAGVGRTGTLVAIDSLLQEMDEQGEVTIFNTICDLRHQRNYMVQSLKQYVFVYRALMEFSQFGDTEIPADKLSAVYTKLGGTDPGRPRCRLEDEFRRLGEVLEERKAFAVGSSEENRDKNRLDYIVPYDVNRVILAPLPSRPLDTYINASFIQGYDVSETYIITQEPLVRTRADFWRMVLDLEVSAIVMLSAEPGAPPGPSSELPEDEQPAAAEEQGAYWPELEHTDTHDHIAVKCTGDTATAGAYSWRTFTVASLKGADSVTTAQLQLAGWPPAPAAAQQLVQPLLQLLTRLDELQDACLNPGPVVVHCNDGGAGASVVVALGILMHQMQRERRMDVFQTVRKLRSQRQGMVQHLEHYDLLYRMAVEYASRSQTRGNGHL